MITSNPKIQSKRPANSIPDDRRFESETAALQSLRLIAAPNPEDDLSDEEIENICKGSAYSSDLIRSLIDCIKSI
jgi:hypothetical protein